MIRKARLMSKKEKADILERAFGAWGKSKETGLEYVRKIRYEEEKKLKRLFRKG